MSDLVKVKYVGPDPDGVRVGVPDSDLVIECPHGQTVEIPSDLAYGYSLPAFDENGPVLDERGQHVETRVAGGLLEQSANWQVVTEKRQPKDEE